MKEILVDFLLKFEDFDFPNIGTMYIMDFKKLCFIDVSSNNLFLCGYSREDVLKFDFLDFHRAVVCPEDRTLMEQIFAYILKRVNVRDTQMSDIKYFSFDLRIGVHSQILQKSGYVMTRHTLKPIIVDGQIRVGICLVTGSAQKKSGNLRIYYKSNTDFFDKYSDKTGEWTRQEVKPLTEKEKWVLIFSRQGLNNKQIADKLDIAYSTLRKTNMQICKKMGVETMLHATHAPIYSSNYPNDEIKNND